MEPASSPTHCNHQKASDCHGCFALRLVCCVGCKRYSSPLSHPLSPPLSPNKRTTPSRSKAKAEIEYMSGGRRCKQKLKLSIRFKGDASRTRDASTSTSVKPKQTVEASRQLARLKQRVCGIEEATRYRLGTLSSKRRQDSILPRYPDHRVLR